jgi:hypothetical protein
LPGRTNLSKMTLCDMSASKFFAAQSGLSEPLGDIIFLRWVIVSLALGNLCGLKFRIWFDRVINCDWSRVNDREHI